MSNARDISTVSGDLIEELEGTVERVIFHNPENGYMVIRFTPVQGGEAMLVGNFLNVGEGLMLTVRGKWSVHPRFGRQFKVSEYEANLPRSEIGMRKYMEHFIKGIGPVMAKKIVKHFGEETADVIERQPERLREVPGIGRGKYETIRASWEEHRKLKSVMMFLQSHGIGPGTAMKIFNTYGDASVKVLKDNPYILASEVYGIGFRIADRIAMSLGMEKDSPMRIEAGLKYTLETASNDGHVYLPRLELIEKASEILECDIGQAEQSLSILLDRDSAIIEEDHRIYSSRFHYAECKIAERLTWIIRSDKSSFGLSYKEEDIRNIEKQLGFPLTEKQRSVIDVLANNNVVILTGGPGTGKTFSTRAVINLFHQNGFSILLAAPTGRAAKRMTEATGWPSRTIHRLLEYQPVDKNFFRNKDHPLECDLLVLDETSMIDVLLMYHVINACREGMKILFVGDIDQLPSVGPGNVLGDLISSGCISTVRLDVVFRQEAQSSIICNAHLINQGKMPVMAKDRRGNFFFSNKENPQEALESIVRICTERIPKQFQLDPQTDIQVITPMYRGPIGVDNLNKVLRDRINPGVDVKCGSKMFRVGDRVMQIKNNYDKEVFNGDVGFIRNIYLEGGQLSIEFSDHRVKYQFAELDQLVLAYAITVHKSQGSEYKAVVMPVSTQHYIMLQRNLLYTGITRAEKLVVLVGTKKAIAIAVKNNKIEERYTSLAERIEAEMNKKSLFK